LIPCPQNYVRRIKIKKKNEKRKTKKNIKRAGVKFVYGEQSRVLSIALFNVHPVTNAQKITQQLRRSFLNCKESKEKTT
jgi:hypothetical protein